MHNAGNDRSGSSRLSALHSPEQRPCRVHHIVKNDHTAPRHVTDYIRVPNVIPIPTVHYGQVDIQPTGKCASPGNTPGIRSHNHFITPDVPSYSIQKDSGSKEMLYGNIEKALDLVSVQIYRNDSMRPCDSQQVRHQPGSDGNPRFILLILAPIGVVRNHNVDAPSRSPLESIDHYEKLDEILIHGRASRLDNVYVFSPDIMLNLYTNFTITEATDQGPGSFHSEMQTDLPGKLRVGIAR
jgi:hypothetical protein